MFCVCCVSPDPVSVHQGDEIGLGQERRRLGLAIKKVNGRGLKLVNLVVVWKGNVKFRNRMSLWFVM